MARMVATKVMVVGHSVAALLAARDLARARHPVLLLAPLQHPEPAADGLLNSESWALDEVVGEIGSRRSIDVVRGGKLVKLTGQPKFYSAWVEEPDGETAEYTVGAVVMAQGPPPAGEKQAKDMDEYLRLAGILGIEVDANGYGHAPGDGPEQREGIYLVGTAKGLDTLLNQLDHMEPVLDALSDLLGLQPARQ